MADWTEHVDPGSGKTYYYNAGTGVTSWDPPAGWGAAAASDASDWQKLYDSSSAKDYFYNAKTGVTQWDPPAGWKEEAPKAAKPASSSSSAASSVEPSSTVRSSVARKGVVSRRSAIAKRSNAKPQTVGEKLAARAKKFVAMRKTEKAKSQPSAFARKRMGGATIPAAAGKAAASATTAAAPASAASAWQAHTDPGSGKTYYYNPTTGETAWEIPA